ncbi:agmatinase [Dongia mobilis]|uniref:Agmatinase n=1 Tax=Dongia mobilis TaxID=578943 RepID=A0A4R6WSF9_9PROT|nr:arginase family protein [Dongia mobilis]TDQ81543.1 agmatinase [Dongia mobilis]
MLSRPNRGFLDWPIVTDPGARRADVAIVGIPLSEPYPRDPWPNDQANAPQWVRRQSIQFCDGRDHWDFDNGAPLAEFLPPHCHDLGDLVWDGGDYGSFLARAGELFAGLWRTSTQVFGIGGDHGATIPLLHGLAGLGEKIHIVHIDAHLDWRDEVQGIRNGYSSPLRRASELPWIGGMTQIGLRGTGSARRPEVEAALAWGSRLIPAHEVHAHGIDWVIDQIPGDQPVFITIDADGVDPSIMPAVLAPSPGGLTAPQMFRLIRAIASRQRLVGMDVVEIAPAWEPANGLTAIMAGRMFLQALGASWKR